MEADPYEGDPKEAISRHEFNVGSVARVRRFDFDPANWYVSFLRDAELR
jgi:hypothetical protein